MLRVQINAPAPPKLATRLYPGRLVKFLKGEKAGPYSPLPREGAVLSVTEKRTTGKDTYYTLRDFLRNSSYTVKELGSLFGAVSKREKGQLREELLQAVKSGKLYISGGGTSPLGTDPEVFVLNDQDEVVPAFAFLPDKKSPLAFTTHYGTGRAFWDGFQTEFTVAPFSCHANGADDVRYGLKTILNSARKIEPKAKLSWRSVVELPPETMASTPSEHLLLGCAPSKNAYFEGPNPRLTGDPSQLPLRFAGCHIHLTCPNSTEAVYQRMVKFLDKTLGVISVCLFRDMEDVRRRQYYGLAGEYRTPAHGLEYRVLGAAVLAHPLTYHLCFDLARCLGGMARNQYDHLWECGDDEAQEAINNLNLPLAEEILQRNQIVLENVLGQLYGTGSSGHKKAIRLIREGALHCLDLASMEKSWLLDSSWGGHSNGDYHTIGRFPLKEKE